MDIKRQRERLNELSIDFNVRGEDRSDENVLKLRYRPAFITPRVEEEIADASTSQALSILLVGMVADWDMHSDGTPVPIDAETLRDIPVQILAKITSDIAEDVQKRASAEGNS